MDSPNLHRFFKILANQIIGGSKLIYLGRKYRSRVTERYYGSSRR